MNAIQTSALRIGNARGCLEPGFVNYKKGCTRLAAASGKVYHLLAHGRWFSPGISASSTTKTGRHNIADRGQAANTNSIVFCFNRLGLEPTIYRFHKQRVILSIYIIC
jgi:hypothetical protein